MGNGCITIGEALAGFRGVLTGVPTYVGSEQALRDNDASPE
jgi:hypothetical protein